MASSYNKVRHLTKLLWEGYEVWGAISWLATWLGGSALLTALSDLPVYWQLISYVSIALFALLFTALIGRLVVRTINKPANIDPPRIKMDYINISDSPNTTINIVGGSQRDITPVMQPPLSPDTTKQTIEHKNEDIWIPELARDELIIRNKHFDHCTIRGPAVLALLKSVIIEDSIFIGIGSIESTLIEIPIVKPQTGIIGLEDCVFFHCEFQKIAFAGNSQTLNMFRAGTQSE